MDKILLIGFRGTGKSTVGKLLAQKLGWEFRDADEDIEKNIGKTISEIVKEQGWDYFRKLESLYLKDLLGKEKIVCALGGGAVLHQEEMEALKRESLIIWLRAPIEVIIERLKGDPKTGTQRPSLTGMDWETELERINTERTPLYKAYAHFILDTSKGSAIELVDEICLMVKGREVNG